MVRICLRVILLALSAAILALQPVDAQAKLKVFKDYATLQCTGCEMMANEIGRRINITSDKHKKTNMVKGMAKTKVAYEGSELQAVDVLELLCQDIRKNARFKLNQHYRFFTPDPKNEYPDADFYTEAEASGPLLNPTEQLEDMCEEILDNFEDVLTKNIQRHRKLEPLFKGMCVYGLKLCDADYLRDGMGKEKRRYDAWVAKVTKEHEKKQKKKSGSTGAVKDDAKKSKKDK
jgi:hypothetical protein